MPEMRLIDANALYAHVKEEQRRNPHNGHVERMMHNHEHESFLRDIWYAPTIDAVPVVHGEWVVCGDGENVPWMCSHCGKTTAHKYKTMYGKFCPNCGARMDGE